jgi:SOS-response transcriptional repressor LexA
VTTQLTERQARVVETIRNYTDTHGYGPAVRDLADELGISSAGAQRHLDALRRKGAITRTPGVARSLRACAPTT